MDKLVCRRMIVTDEDNKRRDVWFALFELGHINQPICLLSESDMLAFLRNVYMEAPSVVDRLIAETEGA